MKQLITIIILMISASGFSQVIIGDAVGTATNKTAVLLEFANTGNKGIVLPYVTTLPSSPAEGTLVLDASTSTTARVKYFNGSWVDLSGQDGDVTTELSIQPTGIDETNAGAIIGATSSSADGILVLESSTKAMVLPIVASTDDIPSPSPGMMVYINKTDAKRLAVYNGNKWSYWMP